MTPASSRTHAPTQQSDVITVPRPARTPGSAALDRGRWGRHRQIRVELAGVFYDGNTIGCCLRNRGGEVGRSGRLCGVDDWSKEDVAQIGYWLVAEQEHGYATKAVILLTRWLFELGAARVFLTTVAGNQKSVEVARRAGSVYEGTMRSHGVWQAERCDVMWFAALPLEWTVRGTNEHP